ncbi:MAG: hypothetical protein JSS49_18235 [Planctomycetes bacterium]|nr:hypothetical protein [Planctomycetota bacterium]
MSQNRDDDEDNPYSPPESDLDGSGSRRKKSPIERVKGKVMAPAIALVIVGSLGLMMSIVNVVLAVFSGPAIVDPNAPEFLRNIQQASVGPLAIVVQAAFVVFNGVIIGGGVQMMRFQSRVFAIVASVFAIVNVGTCCCVLGAPVGIWCLIVLLSQDVIRAFESAA